MNTTKTLTEKQRLSEILKLTAGGMGEIPAGAEWAEEKLSTVGKVTPSGNSLRGYREAVADLRKQLSENF